MIQQLETVLVMLFNLFMEKMEWQENTQKIVKSKESLNLKMLIQKENIDFSIKKIQEILVNSYNNMKDIQNKM